MGRAMGMCEPQTPRPNGSSVALVMIVTIVTSVTQGTTTRGGFSYIAPLFL